MFPNNLVFSTVALALGMLLKQVSKLILSSCNNMKHTNIKVLFLVTTPFKYKKSF